MQQKRHVIAADIQITLIYIRHMWQGIEILNLWSIGVVHDRAILAVRNSENVFQRLALCVLDNGVIEFFAANKVNGRAILWRLLRQHAHVRTDKTYSDIHPSHVAGHRDSQSVVDRGCARPSHSCGKKFRECLPAACPVRTRQRSNRILCGKQSQWPSNPLETSPATRSRADRQNLL